MAEVETSNYTRKRRGILKRKKLSTRVDLTPMVDLGFLLITFFIFTTSLAEPVAMNLNMPDDRKVIDSTVLMNDKTLTLLVDNDNSIFYYDGIFTGKVNETNYQANGLRRVLITRKQRVRNTFHSNDLVILIKPTEKASYKSIVKCLDEMLINDVSRYMLLDATVNEEQAIQ